MTGIAPHRTEIDGQVGVVIKLVTLLGGDEDVCWAAEHVDLIKAWSLSCPHLHGRAVLWIRQVWEKIVVNDSGVGHLTTSNA